MHPEVVAALINGASLLAATYIASLAGVRIKRNVEKENKLSFKLKIALMDLRFMLDAESSYLEQIGNSPKDTKIKTRELVRREFGYRFSGDNTKSTIAKTLKELS